MKFSTVTIDEREFVLEESCFNHVQKYVEERAASHRDPGGEWTSRLSGPAQEPSEDDLDEEEEETL